MEQIKDFFTALFSQLVSMTETAGFADGFNAVMRFVLPVLAFIIVFRCAKSLLSFRKEPEIWAWLCLPDGTRLPVTHWENIIGRSKRSDLVIDVPTMSRSHAVLTRYDDGSWSISDVGSRGGVFVNGKRTGMAAITINDTLSLGGIEMYLEPITHRQEVIQASSRTKAGREITPGATLFLLTLLQALTALQLLMQVDAQYLRPVFISFAGLAAAEWILFFLTRLLRRSGFEMETMAFFLSTIGMSVVTSKAPESAWKLARASEADKPEAWIPAKVPGTVLVSYMDFGAVPDISYANDQEYISDSYFNSDFIYRGTLPFEGTEGRKVFLDFGGINWKAEVSLNGRALGRIDGAFTRARFDVTDIVRNGDNEVEVLIHRPASPGAAKGNTLKRIPPNGGVLGADNPTFHASIGWDWIPTVRGRNIGIWRDVRFSTKGDVTVSDPLVQTVLNLPETSVADVTVEALLRNTASDARKVLWQGKIGEASFEVPVELAAGEERSVSKTIRMENPRLWWPNRYGEAYLYDASVAVLQDGSVSDELAFKAGLRQLSYSTEDGRLTAWVNGTRVAGLGGNWGFSELNLRYTARDYDIAVGYHKQMNFTMIRNWVGQTADEEFYEACDRHGIMVWQDFWLANPSDGPDPDDEKLFMDNAEDYVRKIRRHPSVVLYCGRNEGMPPASLDAELRKLLAREHSDIFYISHSSRGLVSGEGPYFRHSSSQYFNLRGQDRMHSERGATNVPNYETLLRFIPADKLWPQNDMWGVHDFAIENAQHVDKFNAAVVSRFGEPASAKQFCDLAQWVDYDGFRAVFESRSAERRGILLWMSHNAWPSLVWCPYDYFFDGDAAYFASKKACELVHIQYNAFSGKLEVTNWGADGFGSLQARVALLDMHGAQIRSYDFELPALPGDSTFEGPSVELPAGKVSFLKLGLMDGETLLSENFYVLGDPEDDFCALNELPAAKVCKRWKLSEDAEGYTVSVEIENTGSEPAMMLRLKLLNNAPVNSGPAPTGLSTSAFGSTPDDYRILPVDWSDNYFHLLPGEKKCVTARVLKRHFDIALKPRLELSGFNL